MLHHMGCTWLDLEQALLHHCLNGDTFQQRIKFTPARHTVDVHLDFGTRQLIEFIPSPTLVLLKITSYAKIPGGRVEVWNRSIMKDRKFESECLLSGEST